MFGLERLGAAEGGSVLIPCFCQEDLVFPMDEQDSVLAPGDVPVVF